MGSIKKKPSVSIQLNIPQTMVAMAQQKQVWLEWGRGTGKSTVLAKRVFDLVHELPRAKFSLVGATYQQIITETWPSTKQGLEMFRMFEDIHYVIGRRHKDWPVCFQSPDDYKHCIHFYTGAVFQMVSQDRTSHRGRNIYGWIADEGALLNKKKLDTDVISTNRAGRGQFPGHPLLNSSMVASTIPLTGEGRWFSDMDVKALEDPDNILFLRASALHNRHNLAVDWFDVQRQIMLPHLYDIEVLNIRPPMVSDGFYPQLNSDKHYYTKYNYDYYDLENNKFNPKSLTCDGDDDHDPSRELWVSIDWGARINTMTVAQSYPRELRFIKNFFVKHPRIIDDLVKDFSAYYGSHKKRVVRLFYDPTGNNKVANSKLTFAEQTKRELERNGWNVQLMTTRGSNVSHKDKYMIIGLAMKEENNRLPVIRINKQNCKELITSMENAGAIDGGNGEIKKDKSSERSNTIPQEHATHFSDTFDIIAYHVMKPIIERRFDLVDIITH